MATHHAERPVGEATHDLLPLLIDYLDDVAVRTAERVGAVDGVAVTIDVDRSPVTAGSSSPLAFEVDQLQYAIGTGPCLHALRTGVGQYVPDLAADDRWDGYGPQAAALGAASCVSEPVLIGDRVIGVLKAYSRNRDGIDPDQRALIRVVSTELVGGIGLAQRLTSQAVELDDRAAAMNTRRVIDLALGILTERTGCSVAEAFALLRRYSQQYNVKLNEAARQVVGGRLTEQPEVQAPFQRASD